MDQEDQEEEDEEEEEEDMESKAFQEIHKVVKLWEGVSKGLLKNVEEMKGDNSLGRQVFNCSTEVYNKRKGELKNFVVLTEGKNSTFTDGKRVQYNLEGLEHFNGEYIKILHDIEEYLLRELGLEGYKLCNGHLLETSVGATRQQYQIDFRRSSHSKFVIIPLERGQQLEINHGGEQMSYHLKIDQAFVGDASLVHAGSSVAGHRLHFELVHSASGGANNKTYFRDDQYYPLYD